MSHVTGTVQTVTAVITIGPDSGSPPNAPNTWTHNFAHTLAPTGTKFVILHFRNASLPAANRLEVDVGYGTDEFTSADGGEFWTRPINIHVLPGGLIPIRYITSGATSGSVRLDKYGRGERHAGEQDPTALSNCDPFLPAANYTEPIYDPFWVCNKSAPPVWENVACVPAGDIRRTVAASVGMVVSVHGEHVSTCSVTLIGPDRVITAGHCVADPAEEVFTSSVTFDFQVNCDGTKPAGYDARFHKVTNLIKFRNKTVSGSYFDYCVLVLRVPAGGLGIPPIPMRADVPATGEQIFGIHHPNGAVKKVSRPHPGFATVVASGAGSVRVNLDVSGGSSGSGLFDTTGRIVGVLSNGGACSLSYFPTASILTDLAAPPPPPATRDVMIVFDRSGSMSLAAGTGRTKIQEARDAASLFVQLVRAGTGSRAGLVSFSTVAGMDFALTNVTAASKTTLIGPAPFSGGIVGGIAPGGMTSIGGGLEAARLQFSAPGANPRTILLLTDGLQNTPPMIATVEGALAGIDINVIGYGTEASLDGELLTKLARDHNGLYTRAMSPLHLKKFFGLAFGNIFEAGTLLDPEDVLREGQHAAKPIPFNVCGEDRATIIVGWDRQDAALAARVKSPAGATIIGSSPGVDQAAGRTWLFLCFDLPYDGERDGVWQVEVVRGGGTVEFPAAAVDVRYFVQVIASGGPRLEPVVPARWYYTGDAINPLVELKYADSTFPRAAKVKVTVAKPDAGVGNLLTRSRLRAPVTLDADTIPARQATLAALEAETGRPAVGYAEQTFELFDDAMHGDGTLEPDGVFGNPFKDLLTLDGDYTFHFKATYGETCTATREAVWSIHVVTGVDPSRTGIASAVGATRPDGLREVKVTIVPRDRYGNHVGPGRADALSVTGNAGTTVTGPLEDNGDGSYTAPGVWDPGAGVPPGVVVAQPDRPPVVVQGLPPRDACATWKWLALMLFLLILILLLVLLLK